MSTAPLLSALPSRPACPVAVALFALLTATPLAHAAPFGDGAPVGTVAAVLGMLLLGKTLFRPWFSTRRERRDARWAPGASAGLGLVAAGAAAVSPFVPAGPWQWSGIAWQGLVVATVLAAAAVAVSLARRRPAGAWPRLQQTVVLAWLVLVPATTQWDRWTRHHHAAPAGVRDVRASQLRPLTVEDAGARLADTRPAPGQCTLRLQRPGDPAPVLIATYGRDTGGPDDRLKDPRAWRLRAATLIGLGDGSLGLQDNVGLVRRAGLDWQIDIDPPWTWAQVEGAHVAHRTEAARRAERAGREAAWRAAIQQQRLLSTTVPDPHAETPLRLQPDSAFDRFESPVVVKALEERGLACTRAPASPSGWQCTHAREAWICPVVHLSALCSAPGKRVTGEVLNLQSGVPPDQTGSDTAWFLFQARPASCVLLSRRLSDTAVRAASGPGLLTCDATGAEPDHPVPVLTTELPFPSDSERSRLDDRVRDLRSALDDALREPAPPPAAPLPFRLHAMTTSESACDGTNAPCRRFEARLVADGSPLEVVERCHDAAAAAGHSRFVDLYFKR